MPLIVANWPGINTGSEPCCGMVTPTGGDPPDCPCVHTPSNRGTVPQGQVVAEAGAATTRDPATDAHAQQAIRSRRFTVTTLAPLTELPAQPAETERPALCRSLHASMTRSDMLASAFFM